MAYLSSSAGRTHFAQTKIGKFQFQGGGCPYELDNFKKLLLPLYFIYILKWSIGVLRKIQKV